MEKNFKRTKQGYAVFELHYALDPDKATEKWIANAEKGHPGGRNSLSWRREMELDWSAGSGELIFPQFSELEKQILIDPKEPHHMSQLYGGFDWGDNNPCSFHVYEFTIGGTINVIYEWYQRNIPSAEAAGQAVRKMCPYYDKLQWIAGDPMIWNDNQYTQNGKTSLYQILCNDIAADLRLDKLIPAHNRNDTLMIQKMHLLFSKGKFHISKACQSMIKEFKNLRYVEARADLNSTGKIVNKDNHTWDDCKYFLLTHPSSKQPIEKEKPGTYGYYNKKVAEAQAIADNTGEDFQEVFSDLYEVPPQGTSYGEEIT